MKVILYVGSHGKDSLIVRLGWWLTRLVQKGEFSNVTHVECILAEHEDGSVTIGSASIREGGVRTKRCFLTPEHWIVVDVSKWSVVKARKWFADHDGEPYDARGAFASAMPIQWAQKNHWFCNQAVADPFLNSASIFGPSQFASIAVSIGNIVTADFFGARNASA